MWLCNATTGFITPSLEFTAAKSSTSREHYSRSTTILEAITAA